MQFSNVGCHIDALEQISEYCWYSRQRFGRWISTQIEQGVWIFGFETKTDGLNSSESSYLNDRFQVTLMDDLFENKQSIFNELRRQSSTRSAVASVSPSVSRNSSLTRSESIKSNKGHNAAAIAKSKSRLESRLQSAVKNQTKTLEPQQKTDADEFYDAEASPTPSRLGTQSSSLGLKRSNSPKKKKWTVVSKEESKEGNEKSKKLHPRQLLTVPLMTLFTINHPATSH